MPRLIGPDSLRHPLPAHPTPLRHEAMNRLNSLAMNINAKILPILALLLLPATIARGESQLDSIQQLNEVVVTANRYSEVIPSQKLTGKELESLNSLSVADALRYFSGVQLKDYGGVGGIKTIDIRSMGSNHMGYITTAYSSAMPKTDR